MAKKYYIASYSVDQKVLNKLLGDDGSLEKLFVDSHGLRLRNYSDNRIASAYKPVTEKILHAKIILEENTENDKKHLIHVMTGNLRKKTNEDLNLILTLPINDNFCSTIKKNWFKDTISSNLFLWSDGKEITKVSTVKSIHEVFFGSLKKTIKAIKNKKELRFYGISPWGSNKFIEDVLNFFTSENIYLYCSDVKKFKWPFRHKKIDNAHIYKKENFPHLKCAFVVDKDDNIFWAYIGSANFTEEGFGYSKTQNYEAALFFEGKSAGSKLKDLMNNLHLEGRNNWKPETKKDNSDDKNSEKEDLSLEDEHRSSFDENKKIRYLTSKLMQEKHQKNLSKFGIDETYSFGKNEVKILGNDNFYKLRIIKYEGEAVELENIEFNLLHVGYTEKNQKMNQNQLNDRIGNIYKKLWNKSFIEDSDDDSQDENNKRNSSVEDSNYTAEEWNVRFPLPSEMPDLSIEELREIISKSSIYIDKTEDENQKLFLTIWKDLLTARINEEN